MQLDHLPLGAVGRVRSVAGTDELACRLMEMGLTPGTMVTMVGQAPLGDPLEVEVRGYRLSVRRSEAARVDVEAVRGPTVDRR
jgi:ferrous iron transport protein A